MKKYLCKIIASLLICSSMLALGGCFHYVEELYPLPVPKRENIAYIKILDKPRSIHEFRKEFVIPDDDIDLIINYMESAVPYMGIIESEYENYDYKQIYFSLSFGGTTDFIQMFIFQKDGETFIEWSPDAVTFNFELCKVDNALFDLIESYLK